MKYVEAPNPPSENDPKPRIFLAGTITGSDDWQSKVVEALEDVECTVYNPRRADFPMGDKAEGLRQIGWEFDRLWENTDVFTMWFDKSTVGPICLYELGAALARHKTAMDNGMPPPFAAIIAGGDPEYERRFDVEVQSSKVFGCDAVLHDTLDEHIRVIKEAVERFHDMAEQFARGEDDVEDFDEDDVEDFEPDEQEEEE